MRKLKIRRKIIMELDEDEAELIRYIRKDRLLRKAVMSYFEALAKGNKK